MTAVSFRFSLVFFLFLFHFTSTLISWQLWTPVNVYLNEVPDFGIKFYIIKSFYVVSAGNTVSLNIFFPLLSIISDKLNCSIRIFYLRLLRPSFYFPHSSLSFLRPTTEKRTYELVTFKFNARTIYIWMAMSLIYLLLMRRYIKIYK